MIRDIKIDINKATSICLRYGFKVYAVGITNTSFAVEVMKPDGSLVRYEKLLTGKTIAWAVSKTYKAYALDILNKQQQQNANTTKA
jgi:hypothetical protein